MREKESNFFSEMKTNGIFDSADKLFILYSI